VDSDQSLLAAARAGDRAALEALLRRHQDRVYRFGLKMCRDPEDAKDVLQETLLAMARGIRDFRGASSLSTWLYTIARSFCLKKGRRSKFAPAPEDERSLDAAGEGSPGGLPEAGRPPDEALAGREVERALGQAIGELDPMYREVLLLRDAEGLTAPEVAEVLGLTTQAVKTRLHRARLSVRERVAPLLGVKDEPRAASCPDVLTMYSQHLEDEIGADLCAEMERHLAGCARCQASCDSLKRTLALCRASGPAEVPSPVQDAVRQALAALADTP
jgi:RNA polymerase sigma-70 factor (ECF subfamily)